MFNGTSKPSDRLDDSTSVDRITSQCGTWGCLQPVSQNSAVVSNTQGCMVNKSPNIPIETTTIRTKKWHG